MRARLQLEFTSLRFAARVRVYIYIYGLKLRNVDGGSARARGGIIRFALVVSGLEVRPRMRRRWAEELKEIMERIGIGKLPL